MKEKKTLGEVGGISSLALSPDGRLLATTEFWHRVIRLWDLEEGKELQPLQGHETMVWQVAFSPDGELLGSVSSDQRVLLWQIQSRRPLKRLNGHTSEVWSLAFAPDGQRLYTGSKDESIAVWSARLDSPRDNFPVVNTSASPPLFSRDGSLIAAANGQEDTVTDLVVRDLTNLEIRNTLAGEYVPLWFADGNAELLTLSTNSELHLWDLSQTALRHRVDLSRSAGRVSRAVGSQDGRWVAALSRDRPGIWIVASNSGRVETVLDSSFSGDSWLAFSPDARFLAACGGRTIEVWDLQSRRLAARQQPHKDGISSAFFSPDGRLLASTSVDNTVKIWSVKDWREVAILTGHTKCDYGALPPLRKPTQPSEASYNRRETDGSRIEKCSSQRRLRRRLTRQPSPDKTYEDSGFHRQSGAADFSARFELWSLSFRRQQRNPLPGRCPQCHARAWRWELRRSALVHQSQSGRGCGFHGDYFQGKWHEIVRVTVRRRGSQIGLILFLLIPRMIW